MFHEVREILMHAFVYAACRSLELFLYQSCQFDTLLHVFVLQEFKDDVTFRRVRIETGITLLIIVLY